MEKENRKMNNIKTMKMVKILTISLLIILVTMISFFGIYAQNRNQMSNKVKNYSYAMDLNGARTVKLKLNTDTKDVIKDSEGNIIQSATDEEIKEKGYVKETVANNSDEIKTEENYEKSKEIIQKRLKTLGVQDYIISLNEKSGEIIIEVPEDSNTDTVVGNLNTMGKFEMIDAETNEVLLDNSNIKSSDVLYNTTSTGTAVYLEIAFNKEGKKKLEEITKTYVKMEQENTTNSTTNSTTNDTNTENSVQGDTNSTDTNSAEGTTNTTDGTSNAEETLAEKKITMKLDDQELMSTSFDEVITTGKIQLSVGIATTETSSLQDYVSQARNISTVLDSGKLPLKYDIEKNQYILGSIAEDILVAIEIIVMAILIAIGVIILVVKFKINGALAGISFIGLTSLYLLLIRYANVIISMESIFGVIMMLILNYIFTFMLLKNIEENIKNKKENVVNKSTVETYKKFFIRIVPICIMVVVFCFIKWIPISSFGMISFWGLALIAIYNAIITRYLLALENAK